jgi:PPM family protein phosphatase
MRFSIRAAGLSDQGKLRLNNEDAVWVDSDRGLLIVADGLGGHQSGEVASGMAVSIIAGDFAQTCKNGTAAEISDNRFSSETNRLGSCMKTANRMIFEASNRTPKDRGMGTTCTAAVVANGRVGLAHVGDSRCYLIRRGEMKQLTDDHSLLMEQIRHGLVSKDDEAAHAGQNILTRSLGTEPDVRIDMAEHPLFPGDMLLLCSDGLGKELTDGQVLQIVNETPEPEGLTRRLIDAANAAGGRDNITVVAARVEKPGVSRTIKKLFGSISG